MFNKTKNPHLSIVQFLKSLQINDFAYLHRHLCSEGRIIQSFFFKSKLFYNPQCFAKIATKPVTT